VNRTESPEEQFDGGWIGIVPLGDDQFYEAYIDSGKVSPRSNELRQIKLCQPWRVPQRQLSKSVGRYESEPV
jgi:hypothetical protein